jgi:hypothetical protein
MGGWGGYVEFLLLFCLLSEFRGAGGGKCPEEEHTTCSGGRTIYCHKRGLWGERIFIFYKDKI